MADQISDVLTGGLASDTANSLLTGGLAGSSGDPGDGGGGNGPGNPLTTGDIATIISALMTALETSGVIPGPRYTQAPLVAWLLPPGVPRTINANTLVLGVGDRCDVEAYLVDDSKAAVDVTGATVQARMSFAGAEPGAWIACTIEDGPGGRISYPLQEADTAQSANGILSITIGNGTTNQRSFRGPNVQVIEQ